MSEPRQPLAVVGLSALFPGSQDAPGFWRDILAGRDLIGDVPETHWLVEDYYDPDPQAADKTYARRGAFLQPVDFDPLEHGIPPSLVPATDTSQLLALIAAKQVLEDAVGTDFRHVDRDRASVILGVTSAQELLVELASRLQRPVWLKALREHGLPENEAQAICDRIASSYVPWQEASFPGLLGNVVAGRIANRLDLGGTNCVTDAACASSLAALSMGAAELYLGQSDLVIVGGVETFNDIFMYMCFSKTPALSPTGDCRPFSSRADGTLLGEGIGLVALRRLADAERDGDRVYAVVRGIGSSSDGRAKSIYAPVAEGQAKALRRAYEAAGYGPDTVELVEAHGTGTKAGDAAEFEGLRLVFDAAGRTDRQWCALGSVKSQIGHTKAAAGAASLFKAVMALHHKVLPPTIKVEEPHPGLALETSPFYLNTEARPWIRDGAPPRRASVSSFGFGGSNFHVTLEEYTGQAPRARRVLASPTHLVLLSAQDTAGLLERCARLHDAAETAGALPALGRDSLAGFEAGAPFRLGLIAGDEADLQARLRESRAAIGRDPGQSFSAPAGAYYAAGDGPGRIAFLFSGQGSQRPGMGKELAMAFDAAREPWDRASRAALPTPLHEVVFPRPAFSEARRIADEERLTATEWAQPAIGIASASQLALLRLLGVDADLLAGHSFGEVSALHAAGVLDFEGLLGVARRRGELMAEVASRPGAMLAVAAPAAELHDLIGPWQGEVVIANHNSPRQVVLSGTAEAIAEVLPRLAERGLGARRLPVSTAFHSPIVAASSGPFLEFLRGVPFGPPRRPVLGNADALPYPAEAEAARERLAAQIALPVRFADQVEAMYRDGVRTFVEVGPGAVLTSLVRECLAGRPHRAIGVDRKGQHGLTSLWHALGQLAVAGVRLDFERLFDGFVRPEDPRARKAPALRLAISGTNYGKPYPPPGGAGALPRPNPPSRRGEPVAPPAERARPAETAQMPRPGTSDAGEWVRAHEEIQRHTAEAHEAYLRAMADTHTAFLQAAEASYGALRALLTAEAAAPTRAPLPVSTPAPPQVPAPAAAPAPPSEPEPTEPARTAAAAESSSAPPPGATNLRDTLLNVVADKTGYPADMLSLQMQLESDLGIDSIKRVEILAAIQERVPGLPEVKASDMAALRTLGQIADFLERSAPAGAAAAAASPALAADAAVRPRNGGPAASQDLAALLLSVVADKTGYPADMLSLEMQLESDLGIDSIKRVEILAALQERVPALPEVKAAEMGSLRTLGQILAKLTAGAPPVAAEPAAPRPEPAGGTPIAAEPRRFAVREAAARARGCAVPGLATSGTVFVTDDCTGVAPALAQRLRARGLEAVVVSEPAAEARAVVFLGGLRAVRDEEEAIAVNREAFCAALALAPTLSSEAGAFVTVQDTGGDLGLSGQAPLRAWLAGLPGLVKTAAQEWPRAGLKALDIETATRSAGEIAALLEQELLFGGAELEVGLRADGRRVTLRCEPSPVGAGESVLDERSVLVVTGGGRGVTAACVRELAKARRPRFALLGRSELRDEPPFCWGILDEAQLRRALLEAHRAEGRAPTPAELRAELAGILAGREIAETLGAVRRHGSEALYLPVDVRRPEAVAEALERVRRELGPITGLVHAAGVIADKRLAEKTPEQFDRVFDTKVRGLLALLDAARADPLRLIAVFSSVAGRAGNAGQGDYAMANEVVARVAAAEARRRGASCLVRALDWGPWDGGMVGPELRAVFAERGVPLLGQGEGARMFVAELAGQGGSDVELVLGSAPERLLLSGPDARRELVLDFLVGAGTHPFLASHQVRGAVVLPVVLVLDWFVRAASAARPDLAVAACRDLRVLRGARLTRFEQGEVFRVSCRAAGNGSVATLSLELVGSDGGVHYSATVEMTAPGRAPGASTAGPRAGTEPAPWTAEEAYQGLLFHGPAFRAIRSLDGLAEEAGSATLRGTLELGWGEQAWHTDPAALDGGLQLALLWSLRRLDGPSLPTRIGALVLHREGPWRGEIRCTLVGHEASALRTRSDLLFAAADGSPLAELREVEMHAYAIGEAAAPEAEPAASTTRG